MSDLVSGTELSMKPTVSVVMSTFERPDFLRRAVESVIAQSLTDWELIVVDDHSPTDPSDLIRAFDDPRIRLHRQTQNVGIARNVTTGMKLARGMYLTNLHDDDLIDPTFLKRMISALTSHPDCVLAFADHRVINDDDSVNFYETVKRSTVEGRAQLPGGLYSDFVELAILKRTIFLGLGSVWKAGVVDWDDVANAGDHWDNFSLYLLSCEGSPALFIPEQLAAWRYHSGSNTLQTSGRDGQEVKLRTGLSRVYCYSRYRSDRKISSLWPAIEKEVAAGWASVAIAQLRSGLTNEARFSSRASLRSAYSSRAIVCLVGSYAPTRIRRRIARIERSR